MARFAQGKYSLAISDISGQAFPWNEMVTQWNGLFVHFSEFESKQPQLDPKPSHADPTALPTTRPQQPPSNALRFLSFNPIKSFAAGSSVVNVFEENHGRQHSSYVRFRGPPGIAGVFNNIATIDGLSGAQICDASGFKITPGIFTNITTTLVSNIDVTQTTGIILTSSTGFEINSPRTPGSVSFFSGGTPMNSVNIGGELIAYTGFGAPSNIERTYAVRVESTGSGNKYFIDNVQQDTLSFTKTGTYTFSQSDSSNSGHPLRLATSLDGTEYTTNVTIVGTPGTSGAYTRITVDSSAPATLYYKCNIHSGMGGTINVTEIADNELTGVVRGSFSSTATTHTAGATIRCLQDPLNNYNTDTSDQGGSDTATTGQISGGGYNTSSGPVTLKTIGPQ